MFNNKIILFEYLTIIIPTFNRKQVLSRAIDYYSNFNCKIIIADSSENISDLNITNKNIEYFHLPDFNFSSKLNYCIGLVKTKYACISADDDFLSFNGVSNGIKFLENNIDYSSVHGKYSQFTLENGNIYSTNLTQNFHKLILSDDIIDRIVNSAKLGFNPLFILYKSIVLQKTLEICGTFSELIEYNFNTVPLFYGKQMMLNCFWMARDTKVYTDYSTYGYGSNAKERQIYNLNVKNKLINTLEGKEYAKRFTDLYLSITNATLDESVSFYRKIFFDIFFKENTNQKKSHLKNNNLLYKLIKKYLPHRLLIYIKKYNSPFPFEKDINDWNLMSKYIKKHNL